MGHLGYEMVIELYKDRFYWPNCENEIKEYVTKKFKCLKDKKPNLAQRAPLETITMTQPFELIAMDYLHLDHIVDHFTNFAQIFPTKTKSGRSEADTLFNIYFLDFARPGKGI